MTGSPDSSPSTWLNLEGDGADERFHNMSEGPSTSEPGRRRGRGRGHNKMPQGRFVVTEVTEVGEPAEPSSFVRTFRTACGCLARDYVPITIKAWSGKRGDLTVVPNSLKDALWAKMLETFQFPAGSEELVRKRALFTMCHAWKNFKTMLNKNFVKKNLTPDFDEYPKVKDFWDDFVQYKKSEEAQLMSERNKANSEKNVYPHRLGTGGYRRKIPEWDRREEELVQRDVLPETNYMSQRSRNYVLARGAAISDDGSLTFRNELAQEVTQKITDAHAQCSQGTFQARRENDELTLALGNKEHGGRTRGVGLVPWKVSYPDDRYMYRKRKRGSRNADEVRAEMEAMRRDIHAEMEQRFAEKEEQWRKQMEELTRMGDARLRGTRQDDEAMLGSPSARKSSQASKTTPAELAAVFPVDRITEPTRCILRYRTLGVMIKVGAGQAWPVAAGQLLHNLPLPEGYCKVSLDSVEPMWNDMEIEIAPEPDRFKLGDNVGYIIAWPKCYVELDSIDEDEVNSDEKEGSPDHDPPAPPPARSPPNPDARHPSPRRGKSPESGQPAKGGTTSSKGTSARSSVKSASSVKSSRGGKKLACEMTEKEIAEAVRADVAAHFGKKIAPAEAKVDPKARDHFRVLRSCKQTGRSSEPLKPHEITDYERALRKSKKAKKLHGPDTNDEGIRWQYEKGKPLVSAGRQGALTTHLRRLHEWYLRASAREGITAFSVMYRDEDFHHGNDTFWVEFDQLYQLYHKDALDVSILRLFVL